MNASKSAGRAGDRAAKIGLRDLARLAGVDVSTVSRALNHDPRINAARGKVIRDLARREGYRPRPLRAKRTQAIGVLIGSDQPDRIGGVGEHFLERIAWIAQQMLSGRRMHVNVECYLRAAGAVKLPAVVQENRVDGVLIAGHPSAEMIQRILENGLPAVAINDTALRIGIPCVRSDPTKAIHEAVLRLAAWGHQRFGMLMNDLEYPTSRARVDAYTEALASIDIAMDGQAVVSDLPSEISGGREGVRELLRRGELPTALFCCNDWVALGALMELQAQGVSVPGRVSLVGHDDVSFCPALEPALTSISRSEPAMVARGIALLFDQIAGVAVPPEDHLVEGSVVWRASAGAAPSRLATAAQFRLREDRAPSGARFFFRPSLWPNYGCATMPPCVGCIHFARSS